MIRTETIVIVIDRPLTAKELQEAKCRTEMAIMSLLQEYNALCVENHFQVEDVLVDAEGSDEDRVFNVDIAII